MRIHQHLRTTLTLLLLFTGLFGLIYPGLSTVCLNFVFPDLAVGGLVQDQAGHVCGSQWIGQNFTDPKYFWGRPSATTPAYNASASSGSNLGPSNPALLSNIQSRVQALRTSDPQNTKPIPIDLVTASGSGLDPHISIAAAEYQIARVARLNHLDESVVRQLVQNNILERQWGLFGEPRVNVLLLNVALRHKVENTVEAHA